LYEHLLAVTLRAGGCVLIPCYPSGVVYDLFECLSTHLDKSGFSQVPLFFISPVAETSLAYSNILAEWYDKWNIRTFNSWMYFAHYRLFFCLLSYFMLLGCRQINKTKFIFQRNRSHMLSSWRMPDWNIIRPHMLKDSATTIGNHVSSFVVIPALDSATPYILCNCGAIILYTLLYLLVIEIYMINIIHYVDMYQFHSVLFKHLIWINIFLFYIKLYYLAFFLLNFWYCRTRFSIFGCSCTISAFGYEGGALSHRYFPQFHSS